MDKDSRKELIKSLYLAKQAKRRHKSMSDIIEERDSGHYLEPTNQDIEEELGNLTGFRSDIPKDEVEEMFYGTSSEEQAETDHDE